MDEPSSQLFRLDFARRSEQQSEVPEPSQPKPPPAHLHDAAKQAWTDIVGAGARRLKDADDLVIEFGAVLLALLREGGPRTSLAVRLNTLLIELGLPPGARAEIQPEEALAAFSRTLRARDATG